MKTFWIVMAIIAAAMVFGIAGSFGAFGADLADGGNAQVISMVTPYSGTPETDLTYSQVNKNNAEANKANAEGDATTTLANSKATMNYVEMFLVIIVVFLLIGFVAWAMSKL